MKKSEAIYTLIIVGLILAAVLGVISLLNPDMFWNILRGLGVLAGIGLALLIWRMWSRHHATIYPHMNARRQMEIDQADAQKRHALEIERLAVAREKLAIDRARLDSEHARAMIEAQLETNKLNLLGEKFVLERHLRLTRVETSRDQATHLLDRGGEIITLSSPERRQIAPGRPDVPQIEAPAQPVPTGRELLQNGTVTRNLAEGFITLGLTQSGNLARMKIKRCFSTIVSGLAATGKTTTVFWIICQLVLIGAKLWIVDPHMYFEDEEGNRSLASELDALADSFVFPPCDGTPGQVLDRMRWMYRQLRTRQKPGYIVRADETIIGVMDEFNSIADSTDPRTMVVTHEGQGLNFAQTLALLEREGRKYGLHFMLIGHKWTKQDIGGDNAVRTNATAYMVHKMNDASQANLLLSGQSKDVLALSVGSYWITGATWNEAPAKITTPYISAADLPLLRQIKQRGQVEVINQENVVEGSLATSVTPSDTASRRPASGASVARPQEDTGRDSGRHTGPLRTPADGPADGRSLPAELQAKMLLVLDMDEQSANQNDIIREVWGIESPDTRQGRVAKEELKQIRAYLAAMHRRQIREAH